MIGTVGSRQACISGLTDIWIDGSFEEENEDSHNAAWPHTLLIEVTVTHGIDDAKLERIRALDLPTLEIDLRQLGGQPPRLPGFQRIRARNRDLQRIGNIVTHALINRRLRPPRAPDARRVRRAR